MIALDAGTLRRARNSALFSLRPALAMRGWILTLTSAVMLYVLVGCGGSTKNIQNPAAPAATAVTIVFQPSPAKSISLSATTTLTAVVSNDPSKAGVDWALICPVANTCGRLTPLHTQSGAATSYAPPSTITGNTQSVTIEAFATADHTKNVVAAISVIGFAGNIKGTYVFETRGTDGNGPYRLAGVIVLDGNGGVTSGEQTHSDPLMTVADVITGGSYNIGPDGRGTLTLNTADTNIGQQGIENLSLVFLSNSQAFLATVDNPNLAQSFETSSGSLDLQTATTTPSGGYAFAANGTDLSSPPGPMAIGGVLKIDSPNTISGNGSVADQDDNGAIVHSATLSGTVTNPDQFGAVKFNLTTSLTASPVQFTGYIVDALHIKLIESDNTGTGSGFGATAGLAISQSAATGTFTNNSAFAGNYVFGILGQDITANPSSLASVGLFTADASGNINSGYNDEILNGLLQYISDSFTGTYTLDPSGTGRVDSSITYTVSGPGPEFIFYLTGNGNPPLVLDAESTFGSLGVGLAQPQVAPPFSFNGLYGLKLTQSSGQAESDGTAQITANGTTNTLSGIVDSQIDFLAFPNFQISGTFVPVTTGRFTGALTNSNFTFAPPGNPANTIEVAYYLIDSEHGYVIETDSSASAELTYGYLAPRTAVTQPASAARAKSRR